MLLIINVLAYSFEGVLLMSPQLIFINFSIIFIKLNLLSI